MLAGLGAWLLTGTPRAERPTGSAEVAAVLKAQPSMPFQILVPGYLPEGYDRATLKVDTGRTGPAGEPMVELAYHPRGYDGPPLRLREWVPVNVELERLSGSTSTTTRWGAAWSVAEADTTVMWADVGATRVSAFTSASDAAWRDRLLAVVESLGPASGDQVFSFRVDDPVVKDVPPSEPYVVPADARGVQALSLTVTPGGYDRARFSVKKGVPVEVTFRQVGEVGCGDELLFPATGTGDMTAVHLKDAADTHVLSFTPSRTGRFEFHCGHRMYRGVMVVRD